ncbi:MAG TPA: FAD-binding and (Fe-S)-binding domain-containing protein [Nitrospiraceae bacterium]|nr:FAD-binding and (Fe-S)-binding domain-containing protein [Nitrospiraceae bacterium]
MPLVLPEKSRRTADDLRRLLGSGKVKDDVSSRTAYAVDASIYKITPTAIVLAETDGDIQRVMEYAVDTGVPVTPRAAGTNLTGSAIGTGIILDISRLNRILELNREERWARVQPGLVFAELNRRLARHNLLFGPDPSSGDMCKLGGMLANNSSGPHTLRYGSVRDNVLALRVCLPKTGWLDARSYGMADPSLQSALTAHPALRHVQDLVRQHTSLILAKRPTVTKNSCGYNLFGLVDGFERECFDLPKLFVGSEGTLGVISEATLRLVDRPVFITTALIHFRYLEDVGEAVSRLLSLNPSALEVMDANTLNLIGRARHGIPGDAAATLLAEFDEQGCPGLSSAEQGDRVTTVCRAYRLSCDPVLAFDAEQRDQLWKARKALYPTLYRYGNKKKPINYVDDVVVRADQISELIRYLEEFFKGQQVPVAIFGHIGNGNAHIVPLLDVNDAGDFTRMVEGYHAIHQTVLSRFGGSICGEHGDGRVRAEYVRRMFGEELYGLFTQIKQTCDPAGVMNPGVKISDTSFTEHIDYTRLAKDCATCGKCNSVCPVYDVFQSEDMSARGWFEIVTAQDYSYLDSKRVVDSCLNCQSCRVACPAGVDVSELILKRRAEHPNRMAGLVFSFQSRSWLFEPFLKMAAWTQPLWDRPGPRAWLERLARPFMRRMAETAGLPRDMVLPRLAAKHLRDRHPELIPASESDPLGVAYFHGCAANYFDDGVGDAVIGVLQKLGVKPALPPQRCSGTPIQTYGHVELAKEGARFNLASLHPYETVVTGCASCTLMLKDYPRLFRGEPEVEAAEHLARRVKHITEFVMEAGRPMKTTAQQSDSRKVAYHSSCHLRAAGVTRAPRQVLSHLPGVQFVEMQDADRCAGGAGTYIVKDYATAQKIFERKRRAIAESGADVVATSCPACMIQLTNGLRGKPIVKHVAQLVNESYAADFDAIEPEPPSVV